jgi:Spy/CpxP family protein refolding chaperone
MKANLAVRLGLAIAGVLTAGSALAQGPGGGMGMEPGSGPGFGDHRPPFEQAFGALGDHGRWWNNPKMVERLKLTDAQRKAMDSILLDHRERLIDLRGNVQKAELELEPLMRDDQPNEARILAQIDKVAQARAELEKANARFLLAIRGKLTPEQWKLVQAFREHHGQEIRDWRRNGQGQGGQYQRQGPPGPPPTPPGEAPQGGGPDESVAPGAGAEQ